MTDDVIARATAALEGVTEGPWRTSLLDGIDYEDGSSCIRGGVYPSEHGSAPVFLASGGIDRRDARFIAASRTLVPELLAEVERLQGLQRDDRQNAINAIEERDQANAEVERLRAGRANHEVLMASAAEQYEKLAAEVERLRGALDGLAEDCDAEILYDRAPQVAQAIRNILRGDA